MHPFHFVITGATGYLGSRITAQLLKNGGECTAIARSKLNISAQERVNQILAQSGIASQRLSDVQVISADLSDSFEILTEGIQNPVDTFIHCAAVVKTSRDHREIFKTNVEGTRRAIEIAKKIGAKSFLHIGTGYSCGQGSQDSESMAAVRETTNFGRYNNAYEQSKALAEDLVRQSNLKWTILRPTILCHQNESQSPSSYVTGDDLGLIGWFNLMTTLHEVAARQSLSRIRIPGFINANMNLIDVHELSSFVAKIVSGGLLSAPQFRNQEYLVANRTETPVRELLRALNERGLTKTELQAGTFFRELNFAERIYERQGGFFSSYANQFIRFDTLKLQDALESIGWTYPFQSYHPREFLPKEDFLRVKASIEAKDLSCSR